MVIAGQIEAAMLPEPMTQVAVARGAHLIADSSIMEQTPGVLLFTPQAVMEKPDQIRAFYRAYDRAVNAINSNPDSFRQLIVQAGGFPHLVLDTMIIPHFQTARVPTEAEFNDVVTWMREKGLLSAAPAYRSVVNRSIVGR
jgi:NitT/TauT family transport system substrate-binding protein